MRTVKVLFTLLVLGTVSGQVALPLPSYGPQGAEGEPDRAQRWLIPSSAADRPAHAVLFRPAGDGPFRLAVIAHASTQNVLRRAQMPQPEYRALTEFLTARALPCWFRNAWAMARRGEAISKTRAAATRPTMPAPRAPPPPRSRLAHEFMRGQPFIRKDGAVIIGHSAGGWGALALAHEDPNIVSAIIAFAPGRGGHANDVPIRFARRRR